MILSILGLYEYDPTIFDGLTIPTAADITDEAEKVEDPFIPSKDTLINYIVMECAELELVYPDAAMMRAMIRVWSNTQIEAWRALYNTLLYKYNPIWNKDGTIEETRNLSGSDTRTPDVTTTDTRTPQLSTNDTHTVTNMTTERAGDTEHQITGYDSNTYANDTKDHSTGSDTTNGTETNNRTESGTDRNVRTETGTDTHRTTDTGTITRRETGNIGVTMTQEMISRQREIVQFNLYDFIAEAFKRRFCLLVY